FYGPNESPGPNGANFHDDEFDALYKRAASMQPTEERKQLYRRMQQIVVDKCIWIFKYRRLNFNLIEPWLHGYRFNDISAKYFKYCRVDDAPRTDTVAALNRPQPGWAIGGLAVLVLGVGPKAVVSGRRRRGW